MTMDPSYRQPTSPLLSPHFCQALFARSTSKICLGRRRALSSRMYIRKLAPVPLTFSLPIYQHRLSSPHFCQAALFEIVRNKAHSFDLSNPAPASSCLYPLGPTPRAVQPHRQHGRVSSLSSEELSTVGCENVSWLARSSPRSI